MSEVVDLDLARRRRRVTPLRLPGGEQLTPWSAPDPLSPGTPSKSTRAGVTDAALGSHDIFFPKKSNGTPSYIVPLERSSND